MLTGVNKHQTQVPIVHTLVVMLTGVNKHQTQVPIVHNRHVSDECSRTPEPGTYCPEFGVNQTQVPIVSTLGVMLTSVVEHQTQVPDIYTTGVMLTGINKHQTQVPSVRTLVAMLTGVVEQLGTYYPYSSRDADRCRRAARYLLSVL